jgi:hypothetical protein
MGRAEVNHQICIFIDPFQCTKLITLPKRVLVWRVYTIKTTDNSLRRFHNLAIDALEFGECLCLSLKQCSNRLKRVAIVDSIGKQTISKYHACLPVVVLQDSLKEDLRIRGLWLVVHVTVGKW